MTLRLAIQKSGRLREDSVELIKKLGINISTASEFLRFESKNFPIEFLFLRDDDIPGYVENGVADLGIVGENVLAEKSAKVRVVKKLGFANCRLSIAVPKSSKIKSIKDLEGQKIATSYPNILKKYARNHKIKLNIHYIGGSVEVAPAIDIAPAIFDIVSTGSTLIQNGLKEIETIFKSHKRKKALRDLLFRLDAVLQAGNYKYVVLNCPTNAIENITKILPGIKSPTISPHSDKNWVSMSSVVEESVFWEVLENLKKAGAQGILVMPIEKMIT